MRQDSAVKARIVLVAIGLLVAGTAFAYAGKMEKGRSAEMSAAARRAAVLRLPAGSLSVPELIRALEDPDVLVKRAAVLRMERIGKAALPALKKALRNDDALVRRNAALALGTTGPDGLPYLKRALHDRSPMVRQAAIYGLVKIEPRTNETLELIASAAHDEDGFVQQAVVIAQAQYLQVIGEFRLPYEGWKFRTDPDRIGRDAAWYAVDFDDAGWDDMRTEKSWTQLGYDYIGVSWYRRTVELPENPGGSRALLHFGGVDECAWVWINGHYVGEHDIGPAGWDKPFTLDVSDVIKWGEPNQITVRAMNTAAAGGIWQPVFVRSIGAAR